MMERENLFKGRIARSVKDIADSPWRLNRNLEFDHSIKLPSEVDLSELIEVLDLTGYKQEQKLQDLRILIANLIQADGKPISISMDNNHWVRSQYSAASIFIISLIDQLKNLKIINMKPGFYTEQDSKLTRIWATELLKEYCPLLHTQVIYEPVNLVELSDWSGKLLPYEETAYTWKVKDVLSLVNEVNGAADICRGKEVYKTFLVAIFKQKFTLYGRLHTRGFHHIQGLSEDQRAELTINGDPVIELDFSALHPNLLYSKEGIQYPMEKDPYLAVHPHRLARPYLKHLLLCLLNSKDFTQAERAGNMYLYDKPKEKRVLRGIGITKARPILDAFYDAQKPISHHFCTGKVNGMKTMNLDSKIALDIINDFAKLNIPILSIHDSFIVQKQYKDELVLTMQNRYRKHTKGYEIRIK